MNEKQSEFRADRDCDKIIQGETEIVQEETQKIDKVVGAETKKKKNCLLSVLLEVLWIFVAQTLASNASKDSLH